MRATRQRCYREGMRVIVAVVLLAAAPVTASAQRLPAGVTPEHYTLWFAPDLDKDDLPRPRRHRRAARRAGQRGHAARRGDRVRRGRDRRPAARTQTASVTLDEKTETATLTVPQRDGAPARPRSDIAYTGILNDKLRGFYLSKANGRKYAVTQMEATDARRAFPVVRRAGDTRPPSTSR